MLRIAAELSNPVALARAIENRSCITDDLLSRAVPVTPLEEALASLWSEVLRCKQPNPTANFFELGGDSLKAMRLALRIEDFFNIRFSLDILFSTPDLRSQSSKIEEMLLAQADVTDLQHLLNELN